MSLHSFIHTFIHRPVPKQKMRVSGKLSAFELVTRVEEEVNPVSVDGFQVGVLADEGSYRSSSMAKGRMQNLGRVDSI